MSRQEYRSREHVPFSSFSVLCRRKNEDKKNDMLITNEILQLAFDTPIGTRISIENLNKFPNQIPSLLTVTLSLFIHRQA